MHPDYIMPIENWNNRRRIKSVVQKNNQSETQGDKNSTRIKGQMMITIDQLLESVDLDFEPRWVTKDESGSICLYEHKPKKTKNVNVGLQSLLFMER